jgi:L-lactate dehydrogenase complex protein LldG
MSARDRILGRIREALQHRERAGHPGAFQGWRPAEVAPASGSAMEAFEAVFTRSGGEVVRVADETAARRWLDALAVDCDGVSVGETVPAELRPAGVPAAAEEAALGVSMARGAVGETGSLLLDARDGRRTQLLPPTHVVLLRADDVHTTLVQALQMLHEDLPSAVGLHSGPSKSADIGQILVKGVHGPGRVIALVVEGRTQAARS